jgi:hypothetical protein
MIRFLIKYNFSLINCFKISDDSSQSYRDHHSSSSSSSVSISSLSSIGFSSINSDFTNAANNAGIDALLLAIGLALTSISNAHEDTKRLAEGLVELLRAFTEGDGSSSSSDNELINKYSSILMSNRFNSSKSKKNVTLGLFQSIKEIIIKKSPIMKPIYETLINFKF